MMMRTLLAFVLSAAVLSTAALAQGPGSGGPGPGPTQPWIINGGNIEYNNGCVLVPSTVSGGCQGQTYGVAAAFIGAGPSTTGGASFNIVPGTPPTSPFNGNVWITSAGMFYRAGGATVGPLVGGGSSPLFTVPVTIDLNTAAAPTPLTGSALQIVGPSGTTVRAELDAVASIPRWSCVRGDGTLASPTAVQSGDELCSLNTFGIAGTSWTPVGPQAAFRTYASQNWSSGNNGTYADLALTPTASSTLTEVVKWQALSTGGGSQTIFDNGIGATSTDGLVLSNVTAAASSAQQWSPRVHWTGAGWKTASTAASQVVDFIEELQPIQGSSAPTGALAWSSQVNAGGYTALMALYTDGGLALGSPSGGDEGAGTANLAGALYNNGTGPTGTGGYVRATSPSLVTPALGVATGTSLALGGATIGSNALAVTGTTALGGAVTVTSNAAAAFAVGANGATNPVLQVNAATSTVVTGLDIVGAASGGGLALSVISSNSAEALTINAKGTGTIGIGNVSTGAVTITPATNVIGAFTLGTQQTTQGSVVLANTAAGAYATTLKSSNSATAASTLVLPVALAGSGPVVLTDTVGNGILSWVSPAAASSIAVGSTNVGSALASNDILTTGPVIAGTGVLADSGFTLAGALYNSIGGLGLSNDATTPNSIIDVAKGAAADSTNVQMIALSAFTKTTGGTWVTGSGNAGLDIGAVIASTWYHVYAIWGSAKTNDILLSQAPNLSGVSVTCTNASPMVCTWTGLATGQVPPFQNGTPFQFTSGTPPTGGPTWALNTVYYAVAVSTSTGTFELSTTQGGTAGNSTSTGSALVGKVIPRTPSFDSLQSILSI